MAGAVKQIVSESFRLQEIKVCTERCVCEFSVDVMSKCSKV